MATVTPVLALLISNIFLVLGTGLQSVLLPMRAHLDGFSDSQLGVLGAAYYVGFVAGCVLVPRLVQGVGHIRMFAVLAAVAAQAFLMQGLLDDAAVWVLLRGLTGFCFAGLSMVVESWLNEQTGNGNRGRMMATYTVLTSVCSVGGQLILPLADPSGPVLFAVICLLLTLSLVPVSVTPCRAPAPITQSRLRLGKLYRTSPVGVIGLLFIGLGNGGFWALGPVYAAKLGFSTNEVSAFMAAAVMGGALGQWPIGRLSDRFDRRSVLFAVCLASAGLALALAVLDLPGYLVVLLAAAFGAFGFALYPLCLSHVNDHTKPGEFMETSSGLLLVFGMGAVVGPLVAARLMDAEGPGGLFLFTALMHLALAAFAGWRLFRRAAPPADQRKPFEPEPMPSLALGRLHGAEGTAGAPVPAPAPVTGSPERSPADGPGRPSLRSPRWAAR